MKRNILILLCIQVWGLKAQVQLSSDLRVTGDPSERRVDGLAPPLDLTGAITVEAAVLGSMHWANAVLTVDTLLLSLDLPGSELPEGVLIRFKAPVDLSGPLYIRQSALAALPLTRQDGLDLVPGQVPAGAVAEVILSGGQYVLLGSPGMACPPGSLAFNARGCMDINEVPGFNIYQAADHCAARGGKLCTWDEYYAACTLLGPSLNGLFNDWEWMDDSSNHTHTADQVGRTTCMSQRSAQPIPVASTRCCYHPR